MLASFPISKITLTPNSPIHRVKVRNLLVGVSENNSTYRMVDGWKVVAGEKGVLEIVFDTPEPARYIKIKCLFDNRTDEFAPVENIATFINTPDEIIKVHYLVTSRQEQYTYDAGGNRKSETITQRYPVTRNYEYYPNSSRLMSNEKYNFEYDNNGNLTKKSTINGDIVWNYEYDLLNRLVKVAKNNEDVASYLYDESGLRLKKQGKDKAVYYVFDTGGNVLYEQENREYLEYVYVLGKHFARVDGNLDNLNETTKYFYHTDHLGSTVAVTDEAGQTVWASEYTPFGGKHSVAGEMAKAAKFTGKDLDEDIGLYYFNARWYDQEIGRFITEDSYTGDPNDPRTLNLFTYGANNPLRYIDPSGHSFEDFKDLVGKLTSFLDSGSAIINWVSGKGFKTNSHLNTVQRDKIATSAGGSDVATAQASLAMLGYDLGKYGVDGKQGAYTTKAITEFQKAAGLTPTGKLDAQTTAALNMTVGAGLNKGQIELIGHAMGHYGNLGDKVVETAREDKGKVIYDLGAKYDPETGEYYTWYNNRPTKHIYSEPTLDCSGFIHKTIAEATGYHLPHGAEQQRDSLGTRDHAVVGGLVYIGPRPGRKVPHIVIVTKVDDHGRPIIIIDAASEIGVSEREWPVSWNKRNPQYLKAPWAE